LTASYPLGFYDTTHTVQVYYGALTSKNFGQRRPVRVFPYEGEDRNVTVKSVSDENPSATG
jgi:hypothetical protein